MSTATYTEHLDITSTLRDLEDVCQARVEPPCTKVAVYRVYYSECACGKIVLNLCLYHTERNKMFEDEWECLACPTCAQDIIVEKIVPLRKV